MIQADLFKIPASSSTMTPAARPAFLEKYRFTVRFDQVLIGLISILVLGAVIFCVGVERGKQQALQEVHARKARIPQAALPQGQETVMIDATRIPAPPAAVPVKAEVPAPEPKAEAEPAVEAPTAALPEPAPVLAAAAAAAPERPAGKYTIQIVTYNNAELAKKHIAKLSTKGYQGFVIPSGKFQQVCLNAFQSRSEADSLLKNLKIQNLVPQDAYVRNMPR